MPRVSEKKKNNAGQPYGCDRCPEKIKPGDKYFEWSFRYGGTHRQHISHGKPKQSQLTQSKMSGVYSAVETAEDAIGTADEASDIAQALEECASGVDSVKDEYQDGLDSLPDGLRDAGGPGGQTQERIDNLGSFVDALQSAASDIESEEFDESVELAEGETLDEKREELA